MAYQFTNQVVGKLKITDESGGDITLNGINTRENDANVIMGGVSILFGIVNWGVQDAVRIVNQDVEETE